MVFDHRKLLSDFANTNSSDFCELVCNTTNIDVFCPPPCIKLCPQPDLPTTTTDHHSHKSHNLHLLLIISLSIFSATCLIFGLYAFFKYYKRWDISRRRSAQPHQEVTHDVFLDEDHGPMVDHPIWYIRTIGLQPSIINSITVCKYKRGDGLVEGTECSVCLSEFEEDETLRLLPKCNHAFHIPCIDTWLRSHTNCPLCRAGIVANTTSLPVPVPEQSVDNLVVGEEAEVVISESSDEFRRERGDGDCELRMETEEEGETRVENGAGSGETSMEEVQPRRRSVSMDSVSASMIRVAIANAQSGESTQLAKANQKNMAVVPKKENVNQSLSRLVGGSSIGRSLQNGPVSMKRSFSCSGKVFLSRYTRNQSRNQSTVLPS